jgi:hypothetical protein
MIQKKTGDIIIEFFFDLAHALEDRKQNYPS